MCFRPSNSVVRHPNHVPHLERPPAGPRQEDREGRNICTWPAAALNGDLIRRANLVPPTPDEEVQRSFRTGAPGGGAGQLLAGLGITRGGLERLWRSSHSIIGDLRLPENEGHWNSGSKWLRRSSGGPWALLFGALRRRSDERPARRSTTRAGVAATTVVRAVVPGAATPAEPAPLGRARAGQRRHRACRRALPRRARELPPGHARLRSRAGSRTAAAASWRWGQALRVVAPHCWPSRQTPVAREDRPVTDPPEAHIRMEARLPGCAVDE